LDHPDEYRALMENDPSIAGYSHDSKNGDQSSQFYQQLSKETRKSVAEIGRIFNGGGRDKGTVHLSWRKGTLNAIDKALGVYLCQERHVERAKAALIM